MQRYDTCHSFNSKTGVPEFPPTFIKCNYNYTVFFCASDFYEKQKLKKFSSFKNKDERKSK